MKISTIIVGILLFAVAAAILYGWGTIKQQRQSKDLMNLLFAKGESRIKKQLKKKDSITRAEAEVICSGLQAKLPFSGNRAVVKDTKDFTNKLLDYMVRTGQLTLKNGRYAVTKGDRT